MRRVYFILGCTACGKGATGRELARRLGAEIISVDSMKIYRRMDIGTAKPSAQVRATIPHHCLDIVEPCESFSVALYVQEAERAIQHIHAAGRIPLCVGGTSLYIKALTEGLFEGPAGNAELRQHLRERIVAEGLAKLHEELTWVDPQAASRIHPNDERRIIRALEVFRSTGQPISALQQQWDTPVERYDCVLIALRRDKDDLNRRVNLRVRKMVEAGLVQEARTLFEQGNLSRQAAAAVGYAELFECFQGRCGQEEAIEQIKINTRQLAKKQRTWHRRWAKVQWFDCGPDDTPEQIADRIMEKVEFR